MADPFEVRMRFTTQLQHLSASTTSSLKCAHYALKHRDQDEDLHSCIIEQLERNNMNNRANIMYFLEQLCDLAGRSTKDGHAMYVTMIARDIDRIVDAVAPKDGSGAANVKVVRAVLAGLRGRSVLSTEQVEGLEQGLKGRDTRPEYLMGDDVMADDVKVEGGQQQGDGPQGDVEMTGGIQRAVANQPNGVNKSNGITRVEKRVIEQRIEEDRERNKRLRESVWAVGTKDAEELDKMWEEGSNAGIDDLVMYGEEAAERRQTSHYANL
ncbi:putative ctd kinase subunit gamma [Phaeomoniella chlamydospora]|uniref:Putative ctd kinase subunit gamma n=1 Tax=Phaeomoniella chlamydospora TaxID=158046 RepID=A0A0G2G8T1_PHACM|nr:putative ctd kinase subunit gamma [Phaeomoniella chlamydospora]